MNEKKCKVLRRLAREEMPDYPVVSYEKQTVHQREVLDIYGNKVQVPITDPIKLALCQRKYYHFLQRTVKERLAA